MVSDGTPNAGIIQPTGTKHMEQKFCQSCGMPLNEHNHGTNADDTPQRIEMYYQFNKQGFCALLDSIAR